jgi:hypothetical protein
MRKDLADLIANQPKNARPLEERHVALEKSAFLLYNRFADLQLQHDALLEENAKLQKKVDALTLDNVQLHMAMSLGNYE